MRQLREAEQHGWIWQAIGDEATLIPRGVQVEAIDSDEVGYTYQKITHGGVPVAFIRTDVSGQREALLPPVAAQPADGPDIP